MHIYSWGLQTRRHKSYSESFGIGKFDLQLLIIKFMIFPQLFFFSGGVNYKWSNQTQQGLHVGKLL